MFLLDTNVISEMRRARLHGSVLAWMRETPHEQLFISAVTAGEVQRGIELTRERDPERAAALEEWLDEIVVTQTFVPMDERTFREAARMLRGRPTDDMNDVMIAATARVYGFTVATRNVRHFEPFGVPVLDPFAPAP